MAFSVLAALVLGAIHYQTESTTCGEIGLLREHTKYFEHDSESLAILRPDPTPIEELPFDHQVSRVVSDSGRRALVRVTTGDEVW